MNILIIGQGGREHTLAWKLKQSKKVDHIYCAPGNAGTLEAAENFDIQVDDFEKIGFLVQEKNIDLTVVGPEAPLVSGIVDYFKENGLVNQGHQIFGPEKSAAIIEGSKVFAKQLMKKYNIPTAEGESFKEVNKAMEYIELNDWRSHHLVIKADGLAAGKGVIICHNIEEMREAIQKIMVDKEFGSAGEKVVIEEKLEGEEASILALTDGKTIKLLASSQDHKAIFNGDKGPNTGGMGAYAPACIITPKMEKQIYKEILLPTIQGLSSEKIFYQGCLYAGLMITQEGPKVLEFNCRFGDPETQAVLTLLQNDLVDLLMACLSGRLDKEEIKNKTGAACCVVMVSKGYPGKYEKGKEIFGLDKIKGMKNIQVFHAGTKKENGKIITSGGRVLGVTAYAHNIKEAIFKAYQGVDKIKWSGEYHRKDIGRRALKNK
ncbi:phosphoribosylamine--glycine ligase [Patescibacteria group bacterium]|nr:phosphoribosylamine--glycine ligase [Patescibacteria group bacterium]